MIKQGGAEVLTLPTNHNLHDQISTELYKKRLLAALIWLIDKGRELELTYHGEEYFLSRSGSNEYVSLWHGQEEQAFDSMDDLIEHAAIGKLHFIDAWPEMEPRYLY